MPEITVLIYTARDDYPYAGKATDWFCFEPFLRTLADQTFKDFELVLVDALWETRADWFRDHPQPFVVKHVPSSPNYWHARGRPGLSAQLNRGFIWADGKYVWMGSESCLFPPHHLQLVSDLFRSGKVPVGWYCGERGRRPGGMYKLPASVPAMQGYTADDLELTIDPRVFSFQEDSSLVLFPVDGNLYYGYSGAPLDAAIAVNGFDEMLDGTKAFQDIEFGGRLHKHGCQLVMHRNLYAVEVLARARGDGSYSLGGVTLGGGFHCLHGVIGHQRETDRRVNRRLPVDYAEDVIARICRGSCAARVDCEATSSVFPLFGGTEVTARERYVAAPDYELAAEREKRNRGEAPYDRGFVQTVSAGVA